MATKVLGREYLEYTPYEVPVVRDYDELYKKAVAEGTAAVDAQANEYKQQNDQRFDTYSTQVDQSAGEQAKIHEKSITEAEDSARQQYDENHINELIARKNVENAMADMGLTNSGLNRSEQTRIAVMRGNADATTRGITAKRVATLKDAIAQVYVAAEQAKLAYRQGLDDEFNSWKRSAIASMQQAAADNAAEQVAADQEAAQKIIELNDENYWKTTEHNRGVDEFYTELENDNYWKQLEHDREVEQFAAKLESDNYWRQVEYDRAIEEFNLDYALKVASAQEDALSDYIDSRESYRKELVDGGMSNSDALAMAYAQYPSQEGEYNYSEEDNAYYQSYTEGLNRGYDTTTAQVYASGNKTEAKALNAAKFVKNFDFEVSGWSTFWTSQKDGDGRLVAQKVREILSENDSYKLMDAEERKYVASAAIVRGVNQSFPNESDKSNRNRIYAACNHFSEADSAFAIALYNGEKEEQSKKSPSVNTTVSDEQGKKAGINPIYTQVR